MSDSNSMWPFQEISAEEGLDINEIFGTGTSNGAAAPEANPFQVPRQAAPAPETTTPHVEQPPTSPAAPQAEQTPAPQPAAVTIPPATIPAAEPVPSNPLEAAFEAKTVENAKASLFEKKPVFCHKSAKEVIEDPTMTFEELRIRKSEDFLDLEEGKNVSWSVEYGTIRKDVKDPKGTTIISMKESIERSREFLDALKKAKDKNPDCIVRPKVTMKNKGTAAYKGTFPTVEAARNSDKVICLIPSRDALLIEKQDENGENPYVNVIVARTADKDNEVYKKVVEAYQTQLVAEFLLVNYHETFFPAFPYDEGATFAVTEDNVSEISGYKSSKEGKTVVKIGVCGGVSNNEQWIATQKVLDDEGANIYIELVEFDAYNLPNEALNSGDIDLNAFQHKAYLAKDCGANGYDLTVIGDTLIAPLCIYSEKYDSIDAIKEAADAK